MPVSGTNCISPRASAPERARGMKLLSARVCPATQAGSSALTCDCTRMSDSWCMGKRRV
jgi:hypothetical protein